MKRTVVHIVFEKSLRDYFYREDGWVAKIGGMIVRQPASRKAQIDYWRLELAENYRFYGIPGQLVIHTKGSKGKPTRIQSERTFGRDPVKTKG